MIHRASYNRPESFHSSPAQLRSSVHWDSKNIWSDARTSATTHRRKQLPQLTSPKFKVEGSSLEIDHA